MFNWLKNLFARVIRYLLCALLLHIIDQVTSAYASHTLMYDMIPQLFFFFLEVNTRMQDYTYGEAAVMQL